MKQLALAIILTFRFLLELALLAGVAVCLLTVTSGWWRWPVAAVGVVAVATVWGLLLSPKALIKLPNLIALTIEAALFVGTGMALIQIGHTTAGTVGIIVWLVHRVALSTRILSSNQ